MTQMKKSLIAILALSSCLTPPTEGSPSYRVYNGIATRYSDPAVVRSLGSLNREYRDSYGFYRYVRGQRMYVACHDPGLDPRLDQCRGSVIIPGIGRTGGGVFVSATGEPNYYYNTGGSGITGYGSYRTYGYLRSGGRPSWTSYDRRNYYGRSYYNDRRRGDQRCPYDDYGTLGSRQRYYYRRRGRNANPDDAEIEVDVKAQAANGTDLEELFEILYKEADEAANTINVTSPGKPSKESKRVPRQFIYRNGYRESYYGGSGYNYAGVQCDPACAWLAELSCDLDPEMNNDIIGTNLDDDIVDNTIIGDVVDGDDSDVVVVDRSRNRFYNNRRWRNSYRRRRPYRTGLRGSGVRVRWTRVYDSHYPRGRYRDALDYFGSRARTMNNGQVLVIDPVYPEDKGIYICEVVEDGYRSSRRYPRVIRKEVRFYPQYPCE